MSKVLKGGDPWMDAYIAQVRKRNADRMSKCHICKGKATTITAIKIPNTSHQFNTIPGIREDILEILLNLKQIIFKTKIKDKISGKLYAEGPGIITANCLQFNNSVEIINPNQYIGTITSNQKIEFDIILESGTGYQLEDQNQQKYKNFLKIDAVFMPVINVNFKVNNKYLRYNDTKESLFLDITTNGSLTPEEALSEAAKELIKWFLDLSNEKIIKLEYSFELKENILVL